MSQDDATLSLLSDEDYASAVHFTLLLALALVSRICEDSIPTHD